MEYSQKQTQSSSPINRRVCQIIIAVLLLILAVLHIRPWALASDAGREEQLASYRAQALGGLSVDAVALADSRTEGAVEVQLWRVTAGGEDYYQVAAWGGALFGLWYPLPFSGADPMGWISSAELDDPPDRFHFSFGYNGLFLKWYDDYNIGISSSAELSVLEKEPHHGLF